MEFFKIKSKQKKYSTFADESPKRIRYTKNMNNLKEIRLKYKITQAELARRLGTTQGQICRLEISTRRLSDHWLERLSKALNCTKAELLGEAPQYTRREMAFVDLFRRMSDSEQLELLDQLLQKDEDKKKTG